jgi:hypothetical protein
MESTGEKRSVAEWFSAGTNPTISDSQPSKECALITPDYDNQKDYLPGDVPSIRAFLKRLY